MSDNYPLSSFHRESDVFCRTSKAPSFIRVTLQKLEHRTKFLFKNLIKGNKVAIGPFEYAGSGFVYKGAGGVVKCVVQSFYSFGLPDRCT